VGLDVGEGLLPGRFGVRRVLRESGIRTRHGQFSIDE
jgi:hypothetical protein